MPRPMLRLRPDGTAEEFRWNEEGGEALPRLNPGERIHWLNDYGSIDDEIGSPITYEDQQPGGIDYIPDAEDTAEVCAHCGGTREHPGNPGGRPVAPGTPCPWCTKDQTIRIDHADGTTDYVSWWANAPLGSPETYERIGDRVFTVDRQTGAPTEYTRPPARRGGTTDERTRPMTDPMTSASAGAIENLPGYGRYMTGLQPQVVANHEDSAATAKRLRDQAAAIDAGVDTLTAMRADAATIAEGRQVAELAHAAAEMAAQLAAKEADLADSIAAVLRGLHRHDAVQESHDNNVHLERGAYDGN